MNINHTCHFHPGHNIIKFCRSPQCTLPLCQECEPIHLEEHNINGTEPQIVRFNEAYLQATNTIQEYLDTNKKFYQQQEKRIETDRKQTMQLVEKYYQVAKDMVQNVKGQLVRVEEKLNKLKKGSIKTLIFFYSGEISLDTPELEFEPLFQKVKNLMNPSKEFQQNVINNPAPITYTTFTNPVSNSSKPLETAQNPNKKYQQRVSQPKQALKIKEQTNQEDNRRSKATSVSKQGNIFANIQQIKDSRGRQKSRKSIFEQYRKRAVNQYEPKNRQVRPKYQYSRQIQIQNQQNQMFTVEPSPKFNKENSDRQFVKMQPSRVHSYGSNRGSQHQEVITRQQVRQQEVFYRPHRRELTFQGQIEDKKNYKIRPLHPSDLNIQREPLVQQSNRQKSADYLELKGQYAQGKVQYGRQQIDFIQQKQRAEYVHPIIDQVPPRVDYVQQRRDSIQRGQSTPGNMIANQRTKSVSLVHLRQGTNEKVYDKQAGRGIQFDLKKQVLPPEQIRKMLQKRMQERNRVLSIKKCDAVHIQQQRQGWRNYQTRDSIINQIYSGINP